MVISCHGQLLHLENLNHFVLEADSVAIQLGSTEIIDFRFWEAC